MRLAAKAEQGDMVLIVADKPKAVANVLGRFRLKLGEELGLIDENAHELLWVVDFPLFEYDEEQGRLMSVHHPFTSPHPDDIDKLDNLEAEGEKRPR